MKGIARACAAAANGSVELVRLVAGVSGYRFWNYGRGGKQQSRPAILAARGRNDGRNHKQTKVYMAESETAGCTV